VFALMLVILLLPDPDPATTPWYQPSN